MGNVKIWKTIAVTILSLICLIIIIVCEINRWPVGSPIASLALGRLLQLLGKCFQDLSDTTNWKTSQRKLQRGGFIDKNTIIRISFSYLYRIKVGNQYLLVLSSRNTGKYQPVGGVYKMQATEKLELKNLFHIMDDDKIKIDDSSQNDYRLRIKNCYLREFIKRFDSNQTKRERIDNLTREFKEELIDTKIVNWEKIKYRYCGRYITDLKFDEPFQTYQIQLFDIVELLPIDNQYKDLLEMAKSTNEQYRFVSAEQILNLGLDIPKGDLHESIGDHSKYILQEKEPELMQISGLGKIHGPMEL